ncbi:MAG: Potassium-transporting ATPase A chain [Pelotomaculum sp. PtaB.Bin104]|nr:MAG: Potassium-transporting ATPase A chain [Pelotomaculum sp. PtaB.Bin104]
MEGKEVRFGVANSALFATVTTAASCGAVNAMHDSLTPLGGLIPMLQIMLGEVVFGGVGSGLYGMLVFVILTVFIIGLMVGRTPEYLGKKIESGETKMATLAVLIPAATILVGSALAAATKTGTSSILNPGPHGLSEMLYAFASAGGNNGSAFAGLSANTLFYNLSIALVILIGRFGVILPVLAIAGNMASKKTAPPGPGTFDTTGVLFAGLLAGTVLIVGALTFFPALALGPIVEHLLMQAGKAF